jgi:hypothetical protein
MTACFIVADKYDSKQSYKDTNGYFSGVDSINNYSVCIENRNGSSYMKYQQEETLKRAYELLKEFSIKPIQSRINCDSFDKEVMLGLEAEIVLFFIFELYVVKIFTNV